MGKLIALDSLISSRRVWRGQSPNLAPSAQPTGHAALDAALPIGGWPEAALTELLLPSAGVGELELLWPTLARLSQAQDGGMIVLVDPPYLPYPAAWRDAGVALPRLQIIRARHRDALWAAEQCLRSGACAAVLCWPQRADDRVLRRLQVAAETGQCLGFALRDMAAARNPSPAALRIAIDSAPRQLRVLKCRGGNVPSKPIAFAHASHAPASAIEPIRNEPARSEAIRIEATPVERGGVIAPLRNSRPRAAAVTSAGLRIEHNAANQAPGEPTPPAPRPAPALTLLHPR
ncbi:translesion DNA synthesis-associated protein ImuA [Lysobacter capsici]|uniref:translesion DNA synthesis-associated protein ImuA n=1 Tax=Lysobacter capsici TaxID=435897 RepID=UPI001C003E1F|nr:translesion DNA synthesis-associated protein ImuA [Lysobacter capsici]